MNKDHWYIKIYTIIVSYIWYKFFPSCKTRLILAWNLCPKFSNPKILNVQKKKKILFVKTLINTILISNCRRNAVNKSHNNSQNGIWKAILSEIKLQRSLRTSSTITDRRCTKILVLSYLGAHLTFESHPCILRSFLKRTEVLGPRAAPSYSRERWREYDPRSGGRCPTRVETSCVSKKTTLHPCPCTCFPRFSTI